MSIEPNDPTRAGSPLPEGVAVTLSQNEIESLCLKAARGAGMSWGQAEEAGFAAGWLARRGLDGPAALLSQLRRAQGLDWRDICPVVAAGAWRAVDGQCLCPIALGSALCDFAVLPDLALKDAALQVGPVNQPILLLPFLSGLAALRGCAVRIDWPAGAVMVSGEGGIAGDTRALVQAKPGMFALSVSTEPVVAAPNEIAMLQIATQTLRDLNALAMRTTVPPSEQSRADAGAGTNDND